MGSTGSRARVRFIMYIVGIYREKRACDKPITWESWVAAARIFGNFMVVFEVLRKCEAAR